MKHLLLAACVVLGLSVSAVRADSSIGFGARYYRTVDSMPNLFERSDIGFVLGYRTWWTDLISGQFDLVFYDDGGYAGTAKDLYSPQAFLLFGREWYAGFGAGLLFSGGDFSDAPFLILRAGYQHALANWLFLDTNLSYEYGEWGGVNEFDSSVESDTLVLGVGLRAAF